MPTVTGPLLSVSASGSIGKLITYRDTPRGPVALSYSKPTGNATRPQLGIRSMVAWLPQAIATLTPTQLATWANLPNPSDLPLNNLIFSHAMARWAASLAPSLIYPPLTGGYAAIASTRTATVSNGIATVTITPTSIPTPLRGVAIRLGTTLATPLKRDEVIAVYDMPAQNVALPHKIHDLPSGTYQVRWQPFAIDGRKPNPTSAITFTIP